MHSLNGYFGKAQISESDFKAYINKYDQILAEDTNYKGMSYNDWDFLYRGSNIITHILLEYGVYVRYYPIGSLKDQTLLNKNYTFCFDAGHIWGLKGVDTGDITVGGTTVGGVTVGGATVGRATTVAAPPTWYKIDSIGGVSKLGSIPFSTCGFMIPTKPIREFYQCLKTLKSGQSELALAIISILFRYFTGTLEKTKKTAPKDEVELIDKRISYMSSYEDDFRTFETTKNQKILDTMRDELLKRFKD